MQTNDEAMETAKWMSKVADKYNKSILTVIEAFNRSAEIFNDIELIKLNVVKLLSE